MTGFLIVYTLSDLTPRFSIFYCFLVTALCYTIVIYRSDVIEKKYAWGYCAFFMMIGLYVAVLEFGPPARSSQVALVFQVITGANVAVKNDRNNKELDIKSGK